MLRSDLLIITSLRNRKIKLESRKNSKFTSTVYTFIVYTVYTFILVVLLYVLVLYSMLLLLQYITIQLCNIVLYLLFNCTYSNTQTNTVFAVVYYCNAVYFPRATFTYCTPCTPVLHCTTPFRKRDAPYYSKVDSIKYNVLY
jgi:hypothetical protein